MAKPKNGDKSFVNKYKKEIIELNNSLEILSMRQIFANETFLMRVVCFICSMFSEVNDMI